MKRTAILIILLLVPLLLSAQESKIDVKKLYHQFDFWIGSWSVYKYGTDTLVGYSQIESIIDGMGLLENYSVVRGAYQGKSLNTYNPATEQWEQYWIDNSGLSLFLKGGLKDGKMVLEDRIEGDTQKAINKIAWEEEAGGSVRQTWSISRDGGLTWIVAFDGEYKPKK